MLKIAVLFNNYGPYHFARVSYFQKSCLKLGWLTLGIELARYEKEYPWETTRENVNFEIYSAISDKHLEKTSFWQITKHLYSTLAKSKSDIVVIAGYGSPTMVATLLWCLWHGKPAILLSDSKEDDAPRFWWQEKIKGWLITRYTSALVAGKPHKRYLMNLGMKPEAIFLGYDVVGNDAFHPSQIKSLSPPLHKPFFLAINRFVTKKNLPFLVSAYGAYRQLSGDKAWDLVLCGDGELRSQLEAQITQAGIADYVHLPGFLQQNELLPYFAHASCFIHTSIQEQWGLVVNEAMAAGLPVLVSNRCGCYEDLIIEGVNGFGFDPENVQQLTNLMVKMSSEEIDLHKMSDAALAHIQRFSPDYFAQGLTQAVKYALAKH
ncbi:glycosyltransferase family 4 protein [Umezakia ovalisporum]|uniref:glycosyltransferase family 4 protein n=1 Tax=Umezakia ovalisporum TaxID=75695 RepID=UPI002476179A|nr:glycosyltransferase family 4 protein [Umezakia ovalisporum]MDH6083764.1 glycosyltransferase family 4 protein [Umezakia ovalisporum TAC611]